MKEIIYKLINWLNRYTQKLIDKRVENRFKKFNYLIDQQYKTTISDTINTDKTDKTIIFI